MDIIIDEHCVCVYVCVCVFLCVCRWQLAPIERRRWVRAGEWGNGSLFNRTGSLVRIKRMRKKMNTITARRKNDFSTKLVVNLGKVA